MMYLAVVVLAVAALSAAEPEADPGYLYANYGYPYAHHYPYYYPRLATGYGHALPNGYTHVQRLHKREADPQVFLNAAAPFHPYSSLGYAPYSYAPYSYAPYAPLTYAPAALPAPVATVAALPAAPVAAVQTVAPQLRPYTPRDCVTAEGCAVRTLKEHGLAKREAEAEADPFIYSNYGYPYAGLNAFAPYNFNAYAHQGHHAYPYAPYAPYGLNAYNYNIYAGNYGYAAPAALPALPAPVVQKTVVQHVVEAAPAPVVPVVKAAPAPVVQVVQAAPAPVLPILRAAPLPVVRAPVVAPVVEKVAKPVTYTHLGAHPIHPTTVLEEKTQVVGRVVY